MTTTANYGFTLPTVGGDRDAWGAYLVTNWTLNDTTLKAVSDVANAALPKAGGTLTGALVAAVGTVSLPGITFAGDLDCGFYRIGANNLGLALNGAKVVDYATTGVAVTGTLSASGVITASAGLTGNVTGNLTGNVTGNVTGAVTGNASTATALATGRTIGMTGDVTWTTGAFDGSGNVTAAGTLANSGVSAAADANPSSITFDAKGRATSATAGPAFRFQTQYDSGLTATMANDSVIINAAAHSLGGVPSLVSVFLVNDSTDAGYASGDYLLHAQTNGSNSAFGMTISFSTTTITVAVRTSWNVINKDAGGVTTLDLTKWKLRVFAYRIA